MVPEEAAGAARRALLVVEDDATVARGLVRFFRRYHSVTHADDVASAEKALASHDLWCGAVIDIALPDGSGIDLLERLRQRHPLMPVLVLTGHNEPRYVNQAQVLRAEFVSKPPAQENLDAFARRVIALEHYADDRIADVLLHMGRSMSLSPTELRLLSMAVAETPRTEIAQCLGVTDNTLKTLTRRILHKCGEPSLDALTRRVLRQALGS